jgi:hypothetical protein
MATYLSNELAGTTTGTTTAAATGYKPVATVYGARVKRFRASVAMASQTTSDTVVLAVVPAGATFAYGVINTTATTATATVAVGITGTTAKYKAAAAFTTVDTPTLFGTSAQQALASPLSTEETIFLTIGTASLPASGTLIIDLYFSIPN